MTRDDVNNAPKYAGIYCFKNTINGKCYIGQAVKLRQRLRHHWNHWQNEQYAHLYIYRAFKKYGIENFELIILDTFVCALNYDVKPKLDELEKKYIQEYDSYNNGYNMTLGGDAGVLGYKHTDETKAKLSELSTKQAEKRQQNPNNWIKIKILDTDEIIICKSYKEAAEKFDLKLSYVKSAVNHKFLVAKRKYQIRKYNDEFDEVEYGVCSNGRKFSCLTDKDQICEFIKNNPEAPYGEVHQYFELSRKTFYNYRNELGIHSNQRSDTKVKKEEFLEYWNTHNKAECIYHFGISEKRYSKYIQKYVYDK